MKFRIQVVDPGTKVKLIGVLINAFVNIPPSYNIVHVVPQHFHTCKEVQHLTGIHQLFDRLNHELALSDPSPFIKNFIF